MAKNITRNDIAAAFAGILGQDTALALLQRAIEAERIPPGYLFLGPEGVGRRRVALAWATVVLGGRDGHRPVGGHRPNHGQQVREGNHPDLLWVEPTYLHQGRPVTVAEAESLGVKRKTPPQIRLEQVREIARFLGHPPLESERAVVVLEGAETMAESAANGLLKTLEEPGAATLILLAPDHSSLLPTLVSRCQMIPFRRLSTEAMALVLQREGHGEILARADVLALAQGSPGTAIAAWTRLQALPSDLLTHLDQPPTSLRQALELARRLAKELELEDQLWLVDYLQYRHWQRHSPATLIRRLEKTRQALRQFVQPRLVWEVTLMDWADGLG